ncbi:MAG: hypothetical protein ACTSQE_05325 [Candidatus Heimdallarchaeaceae archaeon]
MNFRENLKQTFRDIKKEYQNIETTDKLLDLISLSGIVLFFISIIFMQINDKVNAINIAFSIYPLAVAGITTAYRMKIREDTKTKIQTMFKEYLILMITLTVIVILVVILTVIIFL